MGKLLFLILLSFCFIEEIWGQTEAPIAKISIVGGTNPRDLPIDSNDEVVIRDSDLDGGTVEFLCEGEHPLEWVHTGMNKYSQVFKFNVLEARVDSTTSATGKTFSSKLQFSSIWNDQTSEYQCQYKGTQFAKTFYAFFYITPLFFGPNDNKIFGRIFLNERNVFFVSLEDVIQQSTLLLVWSNIPVADDIVIQFFKGEDDSSLDITQFTYDNRGGLTLILSNITNYWDDYSVVVNEEKQFEFSLHPQLISSPLDNIIDFESRVPVEFTCQHNEPFEFSISVQTEIPSSPTYTNNNGVYTGSWNITPSGLPYRSTLSCEEDSGEGQVSLILASWTFAKVEAATTQMTYNPTTKLHTCCTSYHIKPRLDKVKCETLTECDFAKISVEYDSAVTLYDDNKQTPGEVCVEADLRKYSDNNEDMAHSYLADCGFDFTIGSFEFETRSVKDGVSGILLPGAPLGTSLGFGCDERYDGNVCSSDSTTPLTLELEESVTATCYAERSFYDVPTVEVEYNDGTKDTLDSETYHLFGLGENYWEHTIEVTVDSLEISKVNCKSAELDSNNWKTESIQLKVIPKVTTPPPTTTPSTGTVFSVYKWMLMSFVIMAAAVSSIPIS